jgi:hypothetical protein
MRAVDRLVIGHPRIVQREDCSLAAWYRSLP